MLQLVRVRDDFPVWSDKYDRVFTDIFAIQDEISRGIVNSLRLKRGTGGGATRPVLRLTISTSRACLWNATCHESIERSLAPFEQAIAKDPSFAPAYAGLATAHAARSGFDDPVDRASEISKGWTAAEKAIQLDPLLVEAHDALAMMHAREGKWEQAERSFRRAIDLAPGDPLWHFDFATFLLLPLGRIEEALRQLRIAGELDPLSPAVHSFLRVALRSVGRFDEADAHCQKAAVNEQQKSQCLARALLREGKPTRDWDSGGAVEWPSLDAGAQGLGVAYAHADRRWTQSESRHCAAALCESVHLRRFG
jgi:Tfp pilus assembly protein PilF